METFRYIDDVVSWLKPMNYEEFWYAVDPHYLVIMARSHCDDQIAKGVDGDLVLSCLKYMARDEFAKKQNLQWKPETPWLKLVGSDT
jgi:hypothetical protein